MNGRMSSVAGRTSGHTRLFYPLQHVGYGLVAVLLGWTIGREPMTLHVFIDAGIIDAPLTILYTTDAVIIAVIVIGRSGSAVTAELGSVSPVIVVPAGIPHWFKEVPKSVNYYVVKVIKP